MTSTVKTWKRIADLKKGDIVLAHGGTFRILKDAQYTQDAPCHWQRGIGYVADHGAPNCAFASSECLHGYNKGYFWPGSSWTFQGTTSVLVAIAI